MVLNLHEKETPFAMWKTLIDLFQRNSDAKKLAMRNKIRNFQMGKNEIVVQYLSRFTQDRDELWEVRENFTWSKLVILAHLGLMKSCTTIMIQLMEETSF